MKRRKPDSDPGPGDQHRLGRQVKCIKTEPIDNDHGKVEAERRLMEQNPNYYNEQFGKEVHQREETLKKEYGRNWQHYCKDEPRIHYERGHEHRPVISQYEYNRRQGEKRQGLAGHYSNVGLEDEKPVVVELKPLVRHISAAPAPPVIRETDDIDKAELQERLRIEAIQLDIIRKKATPFVSRIEDDDEYEYFDYGVSLFKRDTKHASDDTSVMEEEGLIEEEQNSQTDTGVTGGSAYNVSHEHEPGSSVCNTSHQTRSCFFNVPLGDSTSHDQDHDNRRVRYRTPSPSLLENSSIIIEDEEKKCN